MNFFNFPAEIRLQIYEELFVLPEPIRLFRTGWPNLNALPPADTALLLYKRYGLCPALLRCSKSVNHEASPLLYSGNRFEFTDMNPTLRRRLTQSAALASFLTKIGHRNASFIRQICIDFPTFENDNPESVALQKESIKMLEIIRDNCTGIAKLETLLCGPYSSGLEIDRSPFGAEAALEPLDTHLEAISSLKEVIVQCIYTSYQGPSDHLKKKMHDLGWTTEVANFTKVAKVDRWRSGTTTEFTYLYRWSKI